MPDNLTNPTQHDNSPDVPVVVDSSVQPQFPAPGRGDMLMNSEERLRLIEDNVRDYAIFTINTDGFIVSWNVGSERILGWREDEILGQSAAVIFTPEDQAGGAHAQEMKKARKAGQAVDERWHQRSDGSRFWASGILTALCDGKELRGYAKILRDFTEKKLSDERFAETNRLLMLSSEIGRAFTEKSLTGDVLLQCAHAIVRNMGAAFARI